MRSRIALNAGTAGRRESTRRLALASLAAAVAAGPAGLLGCASSNPPQEPAMPTDRTAQVRAAETAFAQSMAERRFEAFAAFVADEAIFINGGEPLRGKAAVLAHWRRYFDGPVAPFGWKPEIVEVLTSGTLAYSEGPVWRPDGRVVARYFSTWRLEPDGRWRVVFDNGWEVNAPARP